MVSLEEMRKQYDISGLDRNDLLESPTEMFRNWFEKIEEYDTLEPNAMTLATASNSGKPTSRIVLLKEYDEKGFIFYTNYESTKGIQIESNPYGSLTFNWHPLERQVRIRGKIRKISPEKSKKYFASRPRLSQISVLASKQSTTVESRADLEKLLRSSKKNMRGKKSLCLNIGAVIDLNIRKLNSGKGEETECMTVLFTLVMELHGKLRG